LNGDSLQKYQFLRPIIVWNDNYKMDLREIALRTGGGRK
jgi:hypothetical protein